MNYCCLSEINLKRQNSYKFVFCFKSCSNYTGEWLIKTTGDNHTIQASLVECDIESVTRKGQTLCSWDWDLLVFYNGTFHFFLFLKKSNELLLRSVDFLNVKLISFLALRRMKKITIF